MTQTLKVINGSIHCNKCGELACGSSFCRKHSTSHHCLSMDKTEFSNYVLEDMK